MTASGSETAPAACVLSYRRRSRTSTSTPRPVSSSACASETEIRRTSFVSSLISPITVRVQKRFDRHRGVAAGPAARAREPFRGCRSFMNCLSVSHMNPVSEEYMLKRSIFLGAAALVAALAPTALHAQVGLRPTAVAPHPGLRPTFDRVPLGGAFAGLSGAAHLDQAGTTDWRLCWIGSGNPTAWLLHYAACRAARCRAQDSIRRPSLPRRR